MVMVATLKAMDKSFTLLTLLLLQVWSQPAICHSTVKYLPGFQGPLPFELETGYIGVDESEDVQLFFYFIKSQGNAEEDPLILWLTGGPGCSAFSGLVYEIGGESPLKFEEEEYNGSLPTLVSNPHSWTQASSIIFLDMPVGTGFSYARTPLASESGDFIQVKQIDQFLRQWLMDHQEFLSNPSYIAGDSYSGYTVPAIVQKISNGNEEGTKPLINLKGYILGNPGTDVSVDENSRIPFAHGKGLVSDELFESLKTSCGEEYRIIDPGNAECLKYMLDYYKCVSGINIVEISEPFCAFASLKRIIGRRSLQEKYYQQFLDFNLSIPSALDCRDHAYLLSEYWANDDTVRKALHVQEGSVGKWLRCNYRLNYTFNIGSSIKYHKFLGMKGYRSLIYSGDHDMVVPFFGTQTWIRSLNYSIIDDWRPWHLQGQVAGYTRTYSNRMTFATVKGGGHTAPEYKPAECFEMYKRWTRQEPLRQENASF